MLMVRVLLLISSSILPRLCSRRRLCAPKALPGFLWCLLTPPFSVPSSEEGEHRREDVLALRLRIPLNQCCTSQVWRSFHLIVFSKWDEDKLLDLDAGIGSSGIQTPATVSDLCMSQHLSESSLLFSCSSPLQMVFHSRYKQQYETKFREERDFWCIAKEDGSLCDYRHPKTWD